MKFKVLKCLIVLALLALPLAAHAVTNLPPPRANPAHIDFWISGGATTGESNLISYAGGASPLVGTNLSVDSVYGYYNDGQGTQYPVQYGSLSFTSGAHSTGWTWGSGGISNTIKLTGGIIDLGIDPDSTLLEGIFSFTGVSKVGGTNTFEIVGAEFTDTKDSTLAARYGLSSVTGWKGGLDIIFNSEATLGNTFTSESVLGGVVKNTPVPIPPTLWLLGSGLFGLVGLRRRFKK